MTTPFPLASNPSSVSLLSPLSWSTEANSYKPMDKIMKIATEGGV